MLLLTVLSIGLALVVATVVVHYEILRFASRAAQTRDLPRHGRVLVGITAVFVAHFLEIALYAGAFAAMHAHGGLGRLDGELLGGFGDFLYFSMTSYTTLGVGDIHPIGPMRVLAGIEALNGFVLIGWSASFTYLAMEEFWTDRKG